jgi:predicted nucleic acid-binding protein
MKNVTIALEEEVARWIRVLAARKDIRDLLAWSPVAPGSSVIEQAWTAQDRFGLSWWDALIVAAAQAADCRFLLSEDLQEGQVFGKLKVLNPFLSPHLAEAPEPADL